MSVKSSLTKLSPQLRTMSVRRHLSQWSDLNVFKWLKSVPIFAVNSQQIEIIETPNDFYDKLKVLIILLICLNH